MTATTRALEQSRRIGERARTVIPGGVTSGVRAGELPTPLFFERASGPSLWDVDGNHYYDYVMGQGPLLLGHTPAAVIESATRQLHDGILFGGQHVGEVELAERLVEIIPCAEAVRYNVTGTEADQMAIRLARAATGRDLILKFEGHYHGWSDGVMVNGGSPPAPRIDGGVTVVPESAGIPSALHDLVRVIPWNDTAAVDGAAARYGDRLAAVILEPVMGNGATILPAPGYLEHLRAVCDRIGAVLIFDEIITGFRLGLGGAQGRFGVTPDLAVLGKAMANGFPISCVVGRRELFDGVVTGRVAYAGTFNGSPVSVAASLATLATLSAPGVYEGLESQGARLMTGLESIMSDDRPFLVSGLPSFFGLVAASTAPTDHEDSSRADVGRLKALLPHLVAHGIRISWRGTFFPSTAHGADVVDESLERFALAWRAFRAEEES